MLDHPAAPDPGKPSRNPYSAILAIPGATRFSGAGAIARLRRMNPNLEEASADLGAGTVGCDRSLVQG